MLVSKSDQCLRRRFGFVRLPISSILLNRTRYLLAPLNAVDIYTLLDHLPQRTHVPQLVDGTNNPLNDEIDLRFGGESTDAESEGRMSHVFGSPEGSKDI